MNVLAISLKKLTDRFPNISNVVNRNSDNTVDFHNVYEISLTHWSLYIK